MTAPAAVSAEADRRTGVSSLLDGSGDDGASLGSGGHGDDGSEGDGSSASGGGDDGSLADGSGDDGAGLGAGSGDGAISSGEGGAPGTVDNGYMEGGGCSCSLAAGAHSGDAAWLLLGLGAAVRLIRRQRR
jgi:MYXO-CTERM domain-containing protein